MLVPSFANRKKEDFYFYFKKKVKSENSIQHWYYSEPVTKAAYTLSNESGGANLLPQGLHSASQH